MPEFRRKRNRLPRDSYLGRGAYFLTLCVHERKRVFADGRLVDAILAVLRKTCEAHSFTVYAYSFMPDHLHVILIGESDSSNLTELMRAFKGATTVPARKVGISALWQKGFYDHILRSEKEMGEAAWYMFLNPVRTGLAKRAEDWPYSGSFLFEWKSLAVPAEPFCPPWKKEKAKGKVAT